MDKTVAMMMTESQVELLINYLQNIHTTQCLSSVLWTDGEDLSKDNIYSLTFTIFCVHHCIKRTLVHNILELTSALRRILQLVQKSNEGMQSIVF
jgi:hypothetical protein